MTGSSTGRHGRADDDGRRGAPLWHGTPPWRWIPLPPTTQRPLEPPSPPNPSAEGGAAPSTAHHGRYPPLPCIHLLPPYMMSSNLSF